MDTSKTPSEPQHGHEDYIDMEVSSSSDCCSSTGSPPDNREFEFQMSSVPQEGESITSPADELFYKGKLLPLQLPPRLEMVQKLLQSSNATTSENKAEGPEENYASSSMSWSSTPSTDLSNPFDSDTISPSESGRISSEMNPDDHFFGWSNENKSFICDHPRKSWSKKLKQIKHSSLGQKLKASRAFFKSLFTKSACPDESCAKAACNLDSETFSKTQEPLSKFIKVEKRNAYSDQIDDRFQISASLMKSFEKDVAEDGADGITHRRSFSGVIQRQSASKCSSSSSSSGFSSSASSFSFSSHGLCDLQLLKRSSSANLDLETSIEEAIAHCKQSQQFFSPRKTTSEFAHCSLSTSRISICGDQERIRLCRI